MYKAMNILKRPIYLLTISLLVIVGTSSSYETFEYVNKCSEEGYGAIDMLKGFITDPDMLDARQETGTTHLTVSQIQILTDPEDSSKCEQITSLYTSEPTKLIEGTNEKFYHMVYYKVGEFYFVIIKLRGHPDPEWLILGLEFIDVFDSELNHIMGYSM
jgi:hypothetical protein